MAIKQADFVRVNYKASFSNGWTASNEGQPPIEFMQGDSGLPGVDDALLGHDRGDRLVVDVAAVDAFGERDESLVFDTPMADFVTDVGMRPVVGSDIRGTDPNGREFAARIIEVNDEFARCDPNHPLAGLGVRWEIEIVEAVGGMRALWRALRSDISESGDMSSFWRTISDDISRAQKLP